FMALWGTGYESGRAFIEVEHRHKLIERYWTKPGQTQQGIRVAVTEAMRGGFTLHVTQVRENRGYLESRRIEAPWSNKDLVVKWEEFTSKLLPGQKETWTAVVQKAGDGKTNPAPQQATSVERVVAEMVATLYDESLDAFAPHTWMQAFGVFRQDGSTVQAQF